MFKRTAALLLAFMMAVSAASPAWAAGNTADQTADTKTEASESKEETVKAGWQKNKYLQEDGTFAEGLTKIGKKEYYFVNNKVVKKKLICKIGKNYYSIDKKGVVKAYKGAQIPAAERLRALYGKDVPALSKKKTEALFKKAFMWCAESCIKGKYMGVKKASNYEVYAMSGFANRKGDCKTQASMLAVMAKVLGLKKVKYVEGWIPTERDSKGRYVKSSMSAHSWMTYKDGKTTWVCDPTFNTSTDAAALKKKDKYVGFKFRYGDKGRYAYHNSRKKLLK